MAVIGYNESDAVAKGGVVTNEGVSMIFILGQVASTCPFSTTILAADSKGNLEVDP